MAQETTFAAIGEAGTMAILDRLLAKYLQIDPGRVYFMLLDRERPAPSVLAVGYGADKAHALLSLWATLIKRLYQNPGGALSRLALLKADSWSLTPFVRTYCGKCRHRLTHPCV